MRIVQHLPLLALAGVVLADDKPCTAYADGKYYDLNNLKGRPDSELKTPGGHDLKFNVCQGVTTELYGLKEDIKAENVAGFVRKGHGDFAIGQVKTTLSVVESRPRLVFSDGSNCKASPDGASLGMKASTIVEFICDTSVFGAGKPRLVGQLPPGDDEVGCSYFIEWKTNFACPTSAGGGGFWGFLGMLAIVTLILLMTYTALGTLYNRYVLQLRGFDQIPQFSVESMKYHAREATDWIKDILAAYNTGGNGGYVPGRSAAANPFSHQSQANEELNINNNFVRPQATTIRSQPDTNPVSHHTQSQAETQSTHNSPPPLPPKRSLPQIAPRRVALGSRGPTKEEQDFLLGEEEEEEGQELEDKPSSKSSVPPPLPTNVDASARGSSSTLNRGDANVAAIRGRDSGEDSLRL
ncbi:hypothetical protein Agabi119p4_65 [Agaricus bisporus var. burnettii]|uniref:Autophagy-related protein 27 n=1 Tax=Agaricus bisporus var. burnettii TaxID=192524 RepID=A0A8H7F9T3_AGABI|nr:hypothetical protein Agabi119p4_65 [Agaricus bisporus var. burnettii]